MKSCALATRAAASTCVHGQPASTGPQGEQVEGVLRHCVQLLADGRCLGGKVHLQQMGLLHLTHSLRCSCSHPSPPLRSCHTEGITAGRPSSSVSTPKTRSVASHPYLSHGCVRLAIHDVAEHTATEQQGLLADQTNLQQM